jgi:hypothetical protein
MTAAPEHTARSLEQFSAIRAEVNSRLDGLTKGMSELSDNHERRIAELEQRAALFEEHRQATIRLNEQLHTLKEKMDRDDIETREREKISTERRTLLDRLVGRGVLKPEDRYLAALFDMVLEHCTDDKGRLNSWGRAPYTHALRLLAEAELIRIDEESGDRILATSLPKGDLACKAMAAYMPSGGSADIND